MYKICSRPKASARQQHIAACLMQMLHQQTFSEITVSALCKSAGVPRQVFYRYFDTREDVLRLALDEYVHELFNSVDSGRIDNQDCYLTDLERYFQFCKEHADDIRAIHRSGLADFILDYIVSSMIPDSLPGSRKLFLDQEVVRTSILIWCSGILTVTFLWVQNGCTTPTHRLAEASYQAATPVIIDLMDQRPIPV